MPRGMVVQRSQIITKTVMLTIGNLEKFAQPISLPVNRLTITALCRACTAAQSIFEGFPDLHDEQRPLPLSCSFCCLFDGIWATSSVYCKYGLSPTHSSTFEIMSQLRTNGKPSLQGP